MADVSHELGALRFVVDSSLSSKVAMFNKQTQQHQQQQLLNPFSTASGRVSPKPTFSKDEYGKPLAGSLTEMRGQKANMHVLREMLELCQIIDSEGYSVKDEPKMRVIPFGELFNIYNYISDKVVGILLRARKHKLLEFEGEMLFQRRDDNVPIFLLRPIADIRHELELKIEEIKRAGSPAPQATSLLMDKGAQKQKLSSRSSTPSASPARSKPPTPAQSKTSTPAQSKASSPAPAELEKVEQAPAVPPRPFTPQKLNNITVEQVEQELIETKPTEAAPIVTITFERDGEKAEEKETKNDITRLEGGQEARKPVPTKNTVAPTTPNSDDAQLAEYGQGTVPNINSNLSAGTIELEMSSIHTSLEPVAEENLTIPQPESIDSIVNEDDVTVEDTEVTEQADMA